MLRKNVKFHFGQLQFYIFAEIVFGVRFTLILRRCLLKKRYITEYRQRRSEISFRGTVECQPVVQHKVSTG